MKRFPMVLGLVFLVLALVRSRRIWDLLANGILVDRLSAIIAICAAPTIMGLWWKWNQHETTEAPWRRALLQDRRFLIGVTLVIVLGAGAFLAPVLTATHPNAQPDLIGLSATGPSFLHPFGTDFFSRDVFSRTLYGARWSLTIAVAAVTVLLFAGTVIGIVAGLAGGALDAILMRGVDTGLAVPRLLLLLVLASLWPDLSLFALAVILGGTSWFGLSRMIRAETKSLVKQDFVQAARAMGTPTGVMIRRHILPNLMAPITVAAALGMGQIVLLEAGLSFLGIGARPPTPSWGNIIREGYDVLLTAPWVSIFPGVAIITVVISLSMIGDSIQDALKPRAAASTGTGAL